MRQRNAEIVGCGPNALRALGRRSFLKRAAAALGLSTLRVPAKPLYANTKPIGSAHVIRLFLTGDVMTGRGIDQVLPNPVDPRIYEPYVKSAAEYVELAERLNGPISKPVDFAYIWGDALRELERAGPDVRIINLETSVTVSEDHSPKGINYRMHPKNVPCLQAAGIDVCLLANNHVLDWGPSGLIETLETLRAVDLKTAGAGRDAREALAPAVVEISGKGRVIVLAYRGFASTRWLGGLMRQRNAEIVGCGPNALRALGRRSFLKRAAAALGLSRPSHGTCIDLRIPSAVP